MEGKHYRAIVKNVNFDNDNDNNDRSEEEDEDNGGKGEDDENGVTKRALALYEVEFSDGEIWDGLGGDEIHSDDEEL